MPLRIIRGDITQMEVDAIVNPTNGYFSGRGGTDGAIHRAAGPMLRLALASQDYLDVGNSIVTDAYMLPCKYIIHTHGPRWKDGGPQDTALLESCYRNSLVLAKQNGCRSVAFPLISGGTFGFPNDDALRIAKKTIDAFLNESDMEVFIVAYRSHTFHLGKKLFSDVSQFVSENYIELITEIPATTQPVSEVQHSADYSDLPNLDEMLKHRGETFACMLDRLRDERGLSGPELYKKAWMHKSVYSKIMNNINYQPAKITAVAFGLALELPWELFTELVSSAGYAMTRTSKFDTVIEFFVKHEKYNIEVINSVLNELDPELPLIGL